jgi:hypothetical protein
VTVVAIDQNDDASDPVSQAVMIQVVLLEAGTLYAGGTTGPDIIAFAPQNDSVEVRINGVVEGAFAGVTRIVAFGQNGSDGLSVARGLTVPAELYGGGGNDILRGGSGPNILDGGAGRDDLRGRGNRDLLIGGLGTDLLRGGGNQDILWGGDFLPEASFDERRAALDFILSQWTQSTSYETRTAALESYLLERIVDDDASDSLTGDSGLDWYLARRRGRSADALTSQTPGEQLTVV